MSFVLAVDDDKSILKLLRAVLTLEGHEVVIAHDGPTALLLLDAMPSTTILVLDLVLPDMDGAAILTKARDGGYQGRVLILSGHAHGREISRDLRADAFISKPFELECLITKVSNLARENVSLSVR
jgi:DNA-binding response OmpR family regulator